MRLSPDDILALILLLSGVIWLFYYAIPVDLLIKARKNNLRVKFYPNLIGMRYRNVNPRVILRAMITAAKGKIIVSQAKIESRFRDGGNVVKIVKAITKARRAGLNFSFSHAAEIDAAGEDPLKVVDEALYPKIIKIPYLPVTTKNGDVLTAVIYVELLSNLNTLLSDSNEEIIINRVGRATAELLSDCANFREAFMLTETLLDLIKSKNLDENTAFLIKDIDITVKRI